MPDLQKCHGCGVESDLEGFFKNSGRFFRPGQVILCPLCDHEKHKGVFRSVLPWFAWYGMCAAAVSLPLASGISPLSWLLNASFLAVIFFISVLFHEFGHVLGGLISGHRIFRVEIGEGVVIHESKFNGIPLRFHACLFSGYVLGERPDVDHYRLRRSIFTMGGPGMNVLLILVSVVVLPMDNTLFGGWLDGFVPVRCLLIANCWQLGLSLWPHITKIDGKKYLNDALSLWRLWRNKAPDVKTTALQYQYLEIQMLFNEGKLEDAQTATSKWLEAYPKVEYLRYTAAVIRLYEKQFSESRNLLHELLATLETQSPLKPHVLNAIAFVDMFLQKPEFLPEADEFSRIASEMSGAPVEFHETRCIVLLELGKGEEAIKLAKRVYHNSIKNSTKAYATCCLGIAAGRKGKNVEKSIFFRLARSLDSNCLLLDRENAA